MGAISRARSASNVISPARSTSMNPEVPRPPRVRRVGNSATRFGRRAPTADIVGYVSGRRSQGETPGNGASNAQSTPLGRGRWRAAISAGRPHAKPVGAPARMGEWKLKSATAPAMRPVAAVSGISPPIWFARGMGWVRSFPQFTIRCDHPGASPTTFGADGDEQPAPPACQPAFPSSFPALPSS